MLRSVLPAVHNNTYEIINILYCPKTHMSAGLNGRNGASVEHVAGPNCANSYLPGSETDRDQEGGVSTARPIHCTPGGLTRTTTPNRGGSRAQFLLVGTSVRAVPFIETKKISFYNMFVLSCVCNKAFVTLFVFIQSLLELACVLINVNLNAGVFLIIN